MRLTSLSTTLCFILASMLSSALADGPSWAHLEWKKKGDDDDDDDDDDLTPLSPTKISFQTDLPSNCEPELIPFATQSGGKYKCCLEGRQTQSHEEASLLLSQPFLSATHQKDLEQSIRTFVPEGYAVLWLTTFWWTYEWCPGKYIRQYHDAKGVIESEYILGVGTDVLSPKACETRVRYEDKAETISKKLVKMYGKKKKSLQATGKWSVVAEEGMSPYYTTNYTNGEVCDVTGEERFIELQIHCDDPEVHPPTPPSTFSVEETTPCNYVAKLRLEAICSLSSYVALRSYFNQNLSPKKRIERAKKKRAEVLGAKNLPKVEEAIRKDLAPDGCIVLVSSGWWTYEYCSRMWLRQYHETDSVIETEFFLGRSVDVNSPKHNLLARKHKYKKQDGRVTSVSMQTRASIPKLSANGTWVARGEAGNYHFVTTLTDGCICDLTGKPRVTELQVHCSEEGNKQFTVFETENCRYEAKLHLPSICKLDAYKSLVMGDATYQESRTAGIICAPDNRDLSDITRRPKLPKLPVTLSSSS